MNRQILNSKKNTIFWGWYVVFGTFMIMVVNYGVRYSFGVFVKPMFAEYNWPMTIIQLGASINLIMYALSCILTGRLLDRFPPRRVMIVGILLTSAGLLLAGYVQTPLGLYLSYGVLVGVGTAGCGMVVNSVTVAKWFNRYRGLAIGISSMGIGIGTLLMAPLASYIVSRFGWRCGFFSIGLLMLVVGLSITSLFMGKSGPEQLGLLPDGAEPAGGDIPSAVPTTRPAKPSLKPVLKSSQFWILVCCNSLAVMTVMMTFTCQVAYAINKGFSNLQAAAALGIIGITGSCGKLFFGWFCDHIQDAKYSASIGFFIMAIAMIFLYMAETETTLYIFALIYGFGYGSTAPVMPYLILDRFDRQVFGSAYGLLIFFVTGVGGSIGPVLGGSIFDKTGSYGPGWLICIATLLIVTVFILALKPKAAKAETKRQSPRP